MTQQNEIRKELQKKNQQTKDKIQKQKDNQEVSDFMEDLGIERVDKPKKDERRSKK
ncbi:MAG: hypothetical protein Q8Q01_00910 [archaeon]|nr:hypothetical protein [archaeon]